MFERPRSKNESFKKQDMLYWLSWLASRMVKHNQAPYFLEDMQPNWIGRKQRRTYKTSVWISVSLSAVFFVGLSSWLASWLIINLFVRLYNRGVLVTRFLGGLGTGFLFDGLIVGMFIGLIVGQSFLLVNWFKNIEMVDTLEWDWKKGNKGLIGGLLVGLSIGLSTKIFFFDAKFYSIGRLISSPIFWLSSGLIGGLASGLTSGLRVKHIGKTMSPGRKVSFSIRNFFFIFILVGVVSGISLGLGLGLGFGLVSEALFLDLLFLGLVVGSCAGLIGGLRLGGLAVIQHYMLHLIIARNNLLPWRLVPFLDHCVDLIFLRRVGGGYIFVHRLLMEHFADMYVETPTAKGNQK